MQSLSAHLYASVVREHLWLVSQDSARLLEERVETGFAFSQVEGGRTSIDACDRISALRPEARRLLGVEPSALASMLADTVSGDESALLENFRPVGNRLFRVRSLRRARYVSNGRVDDAQTSAWITASREDTSHSVTVACTEEELSDHLPALLEDPNDCVQTPPGDWRNLPILWPAGSASVLLHEAVGHPAERGLAPEGLPRWLTVADRPSRPGGGTMRLDDCANAAEDKLLSDGATPSCFRRESFRSVPLRRMSNLFAEVRDDAPQIDLPRRFLSVRIVDRGDFDPLTDLVRLTTAVADLIDGDEVTRLSPFTLESTREKICNSIAGGEGPPMCYPGVLCSEDGQKLPVGSFAPVILTSAFSAQ